MDKNLIIKQINANTCVAESALSKKFINETLEYTTTVSYYDWSLKQKVIKKVTKTFAEKLRNGNVSVPPGLINFLSENAHDHSLDIQVVHTEKYNVIKPKIPKLKGINFESYQLELLKHINDNRNGILVAPTASGKSVILGGIVSTLDVPETVLIVPNQTIFNQMYNHFSNWFGAANVGKIGQGFKQQKKITICLYQSLNKYKINNKLQLILVDEAHLINDTMIKFIKKCNHVYYRYGVTATPQKPDNNFIKAMQMYGYIGPILYELQEDSVKERVLPVKVKLISFYCNNPTGNTYQKVLRTDVLLSDVRNAKLLKATKLVALDKGLTCLILLDETKQGEKIVNIAEQMGIDVKLVHGKQKGEDIKEAIKLLNERKIQCVAATKVFGVGTDIPNVDTIVLASSRKSEIDTLQKIGRGRRKTKGVKHTIVIDCMDKVRGKKKFTKHFYLHSLERLNTYKEKGWSIEKIQRMAI